MKLETRSITHGWVGTPKAGVGDREMRIVTDSVGGWECFSLESVGGGGGAAVRAADDEGGEVGWGNFAGDEEEE